MPLALQYLIIAIATLLAVLYVWRSRFPASWRKMRLALAKPLLQKAQPKWVQALGRRLAPATSQQGRRCADKHCGGGCG